MLEFLRKHTIVIMAAMALVFVGLVFIGDNNSGSLSQMFTKTDISVGNQQFSNKQVKQDGVLEFQMAWQLQSSMGDLLDIFSEQNQAFVLKTFNSNNPEAIFMAYRGIIRNEGERLGFYANAEEIDAAIRSLPSFLNEQNQFNQDIYAQFINAQGEQGREMRLKALKSILSDQIVAQKVKALLSTGIEANAAYATMCAESQKQLVELNIIELARDKFAPQTQPGEEQIKEYWEKNKEKYRTGEKRYFNLYTFKPLEQTASEEAGNITNSTQEVLNVVENDIWEIVSNKNGYGLEEAIDQSLANNKNIMSMEKKIFSNIDRSSADATLLESINQAASDGQNNDILSLAFSLTGAPNVSANASEEEINQVMSKIKGDQLSTTQVLNNGNVILVRLNAITPDTAKSYEAAKEEATKDLVAQLTDDNLNKAALELKNKLAEAKASDAFIASAKAAGYEVKSLKPYTILQNLITPELRFMAQTSPTQAAAMLEKIKESPIAPPADFPEADLAFSMTKFINPGQTTEAFASENGLILAQLVKRTIEDSPELSTELELQKLQLDMISKQLIWKDWLKNCVKVYELFINPALNEQR